MSNKRFQHKVSETFHDADMKFKSISVNVIICILLLVMLVTFAICSAVLFFVSNLTNNNRNSSTESFPNSITEPSVQISDPSYTETTTHPQNTANSNESTEHETETPNLPQELQEYLDNGACSLDMLESANTKQLIVVDSYGSSASISFFEMVNGEWTKNESLSCDGFVGFDGTVTNMSEQVNGTPKGFYSIGSAFYQYTVPNTGLSVFEITNDTYWIDDPDSRYYNQRVEGVADKDWNSAEHMIDIPSYKYGFVINYNIAAEYNKGSAIFFHIGSYPTNGCVATSEYMVLEYLAKLDANENPYILII